LGKTLIITEKPSVARDISRCLGGFSSKQGYFESDTFLLSWSFGHLVEIAAPEIEGGKWTPEQLPLFPQFILRVMERGQEQFAVLKGLMHQAECLINACDAGREGELIFRYLCLAAGCQKPFQRLWISSLTAESIRAGFQNLLNGNDFDNLYLAGKSRNEADWVVGINATRTFTIVQRTLFSVGRVQTPTLAFLVQREKEIRNFKAQSYWVARAVFESKPGPVPVKYIGGEEGKILVEAAAKELREQVVGKPAVVIEFEDKETVEPPALPFDLTALQQEGNERWGWTASHTLEVAQSLYEKRKLITYPRTSSRYVTPDLAKTFSRRLQAIGCMPAFSQLVQGLPGFPRFASLPPTNRNIINEQKVTDHHAILPTESIPPPGLSGDEGQLYRLVASSFLALFLAPARWAERSLVVECAGHPFAAKSRQLEEPGWKSLPLFSNKTIKGSVASGSGATVAVSDTVDAASVKAGIQDPTEEEDPVVLIPQLLVGDAGVIDQVELRQEKTKPPRRYSESALLSAMKNAGRRVEDPELPGGDVGLGTPATRAAIVERLKQVGYVEVKGKTLYPTHKGMTLLDVLNVPELKVPDLTVKWENDLREIEAGQKETQEFLTEIKSFTRRLVAEGLKASRRATLRPGEESLGNCPLCGQPVRELPKSYTCLGSPDSCRFVIWKVIWGKQITPAQAKRILKKGESMILKGFVNRPGETFAGKLKPESVARKLKSTR
jgi:DNA topoisomerase-3